MKKRIILSTCLASFLACAAACEKSRPEASENLSQTLQKYSSGLLDKKASWRERRAFLLAKTLNDPEWEKRWWVEKSVRLLRGGRPLGADEDLESLAKLSEDQLLDQLMAATDFGDTVLDFNLFFLGKRFDDIRPRGQYSYNVFDYGSAIESAQAVLTGGDYFKIFDFYGGIYPEPLGVYPRDSIEAGLPEAELRERRLKEFRSAVAAEIATIESQMSTDPIALCNKIMYYNFLNVPLSFGLVNRLIFGAIGPLYDLEVNCGLLTRDMTTARLLANVKQLAQDIETLSNLSADFSHLNYAPKNILEIRKADLKSLGHAGDVFNFPSQLWRTLSNSSTNANRRRAAFVLKQFFCDDLTPIAVEAPSTPTGGAHGSATSCYACHYKLDPMAGFFRDRGLQFLDYSGHAKIYFDDLASQDRDLYAEQWLSKSGTRKWDIGYVRSTTEDKLNSFGETLADLSAIARQSTEAKRCLVKRMFEYFVAEDQTIDAGYLKFLTERFEREAQVNSSGAVKNTIRRLLTSKSFHQSNMDPKACYDFDPAGKASSQLPCRVSAIVESSCVQCHSSTSASGGLDLSQLIRLPDGSQNFPHTDSAGRQQPFGQTFLEIQRRLSSPDPEERMPQKAMSNPDRQELYLWVSEALAKGL